MKCDALVSQVDVACNQQPSVSYPLVVIQNLIRRDVHKIDGSGGSIGVLGEGWLASQHTQTN
jgi:hypothetical protein